MKNLIVIALNNELLAPNAASQGKQLPTIIDLVPIGKVQGRDGRSWTCNHPEQIISAFNAERRPLVIDYEHATERKASKGESAPASGWINRLFVDQGMLKGEVEWTKKALNQIQEKEYRFISPVFFHNPSGEVLKIHSAALTNRPNLHLTALNSELSAAYSQNAAIADIFLEGATTPVPSSPALTLALNPTSYSENKENSMSLKLIAQALTLAETASETEILSAINAQKSDLSKLQTALNSQSSASSNLDLYVPRSEYDLQKNLALNAQTDLNHYKQTQLNAQASAFLEDALKAGKIVPANKDHYLKIALNQENGLEMIQSLISNNPVIAPDSNLTGKAPTTDKTALNTQELAMCSQMNIKPEDFLKTKQGVVTPC